ncbi:MAG TPA: M48 family metalloprotease [Noviherbaspirillum sp.]|uniref:beta-barrel assembly-enhancing protease n=1 Tax=Noviherbaspirillum sp. TaxID=1926288 RepID=UPI002B490500|nr:M48 family metalloprotease [Noviherbaspirillum sp.]HJV83972.1 M48 family metalloprotease [Noviherbaspirillum sp.]
MRLKSVIGIAILSLLPIVAAPSLATEQSLPSLGDTERGELSPLMERKLGEQIMRDIRRDRDYLDDAPVLEYLNNFGSSLVAARPEARGEAGYDFFFFAVRDPMLNAFALPGGFIGVHSGLILAAQNESELASVLAHEIGHVAQRHIARMLGKQKQDSLIPLASAVLAALAARSNPDASAALLMGGQGMALQRQLNFSRDAEREADRIGLGILRDAHFDTSGMIAFFGRLQNATRSYTDAAPAYLRSHPLTTERIADIQARIREQPYRQHADNLDFYLVRSRVRVLQDPSPQGLLDAEVAFESQAEQKSRMQIVAAKYGQALVALRQGAPDKAQDLLKQAYAATSPSGAQSAILSGLGIEIKLAANKPEEALKQADAARAKFPLSRVIAQQYADALIAAGRLDAAVSFLRDQAQLYRQEPKVQDQLARAYAAQGKQALQHLALAESYALSGSMPAAIDQLGIARRSPDASFYDQAVIDAREREFKARWMEEMKEAKQDR